MDTYGRRGNSAAAVCANDENIYNGVFENILFFIKLQVQFLLSIDKNYYWSIKCILPQKNVKFLKYIPLTTRCNAL